MLLEATPLKVRRMSTGERTFSAVILSVQEGGNLFPYLYSCIACIQALGKSVHKPVLIGIINAAVYILLFAPACSVLKLMISIFF